MISRITQELLISGYIANQVLDKVTNSVPICSDLFSSYLHEKRTGGFTA